MRDVGLIALGMAIGAGVGIAAERVSSRPAAGPAAQPELAAPIAPEGQGAAPVPDIRGEAQAAAPSADRVEPPDAQVMLYREDGPVPCDPLCIEALAEAFLSGRAEDDDYNDLYSALPAVAGLIEGDRVRRRRFLGALRDIDLTDTNAQTARDQFTLAVATFHELSPSFAAEIADGLITSAEPEKRAVALWVAQMHPDEAFGRPLIENAISQEPGGPLLLGALESIPGLNDPPSPSTQAAIRQMATRHRDPEVRRAALNAVLWRADTPARERERLLADGLEDDSPLVRLSAVQSAMSQVDGTPFDADDIQSYRALAKAVADDPNADPESRMAALGMLSYGLLREGGPTGHMDHGHY